MVGCYVDGMFGWSLVGGYDEVTHMNHLGYRRLGLMRMVVGG
jgi:hypothetical protein